MSNLRTKIEEAIDILQKQREDYIRLAVNPPFIIKERKNGRLRYEGKRYSCKKYSLEGKEQ